MQLKKFQKGILSLLSVAALDLNSVYQLALERSESLQIQKQNLYQAVEDQKQARGALLPSVRYSYRWFKQDVPPGTSTFSSFRQDEQSTSSLQFNQPLFRGMAEYAGLEIADLGVEQAKLQFTQEELNLYLEVSQLFYQYLQNEAEIRNLTELLANLKERVRELTQRSRIGRSDRSDLLSARSQAALVESDLLEAQSALKTARENLAAKIPGLEVMNLEDDLSLPKLVPDLKSLLARLENRPDLKLAALSTEAAEEQIRVARAGHLPTLDLEGNYYFFRPGVLQDVEWDVGLVLTLPLFEGGRVNSEMRQAASLKTQQELAMARLLREAEAQVKSYYDVFRSQRERLNLLERTVQLSRDNYRSQQRDYKKGLISYLEVIQTEREYWDVRRTLDRSLYTAKLAWIQLLNSVGEHP